jgi:hypothetical protein
MHGQTLDITVQLQPKIWWIFPDEVSSFDSFLIFLACLQSAKTSFSRKMLLPVAGIEYHFIILILFFLCAEPDSKEHHSGRYLFGP